MAETVIIQVRQVTKDADNVRDREYGPWQDYCRCTPEEAHGFITAKDDTKEGPRFRAVDWISRGVLLAEWDFKRNGPAAYYPEGFEPKDDNA